MSTGGVFQLISNTGRQDEMLLATRMLEQRLKDIKKIRCKNPSIKDITPTLSDIEKTHVLYINSHFKPFVSIAYEYDRVGAEGIVGFGSTTSFSIPQFGDFFNDMMVRMVLRGARAVVPGDQVRYCEFPGHRIMQRTEFEVAQVVLDYYNADTLNFHYNFTVPAGKRLGWLRGVGQEVPQQAILTQQIGVDEYRESKMILNGPQTPKAVQPDLELMVPLIFWFNRDCRLSIPSVSIPFGQRFINITLGALDEIVYGVDNGGGGAFIPPTINEMELYINNIFVNPDIHNIFIKRVGFNLIRIHKFANNSINSGADNILLDTLKFPTETIYFGVKPAINIGNADNWHRFHVVTDTLLSYPARIANAAPPPVDQLVFTDAVLKNATPVMTSLAFTAKGIDLYRPTPPSFFNQYIPYNYGGWNINTPIDIGMYMAPFNFYPGSFQPSGHLNLSAVREFYLRFTSNYLSNTTPGALFCLGISINFLLITKGYAVLRYNI